MSLCYPRRQYPTVQLLPNVGYKWALTISLDLARQLNRSDSSQGPMRTTTPLSQNLLPPTSSTSPAANHAICLRHSRVQPRGKRYAVSMHPAVSSLDALREQ